MTKYLKNFTNRPWARFLFKKNNVHTLNMVRLYREMHSKVITRVCLKNKEHLLECRLAIVSFSCIKGFKHNNRCGQGQF